MDDYYKLLGVEKNASAEEIKAAYRKMAHKYHPDKSGGDEKKFKEVNEAYQVLSNPEKRANYDRFGKGFAGGAGQGFGGFGQGMGGDWNINFDASNMGDLQDILESIFGGFGGAARQRRRTYKRGGDLEMMSEITLEEAKAGKTVQAKFETFIECGSCKGVGFDQKGGFDECTQCNGRGEIREERRSFFGNISQIVACRKCGGAGKIPKKPCASCHGAGRIRGFRNATVEIRPGVEDGQIIKIKGMGEAGEHGMEAGDLYVRIKVKSNPNFERRGQDVYVDYPINIIDVLLGKRKEIKNLGGKMVHFEVPPNFNLRDEIRVKGEGMTSSGDLVIKLDVRTPKHLSAKAKKLLDDLQSEL